MYYYAKENTQAVPPLKLVKHNLKINKVIFIKGISINDSEGF